MAYIARWTYRVNATARPVTSYLVADEHTPITRANAIRFATLREASDALYEVYRRNAEAGFSVITSSQIDTVTD